MAKTITLNLRDEGVSAYVDLQRNGINPDEFIEAALVREANRIRGRAVQAAEVRDHERQQVGLEQARDLPSQIDYVRPPR